MGLLDPQLDPMTLGLLQASAGLLAPRRQGGGISAGISGFGNGLLQGQEAQRRMQQEARREDYLRQQMDMQRERFGMDQQRFGFEVEQQKAAQAKAAQQAKFVEEFIATASQRDPEIAALARVNLPAAIERAYPKPEWRTWFDAKGRQTQGYVAPNADPRVVGGSERKVQAVPLGDRVEFVDPLAQSGPLKVGMSPGERDASARGWANNAATLRGQDMADRRAREESGRPVFSQEHGAFFYRPNAQSPTGSFVVPTGPSGERPPMKPVDLAKVETDLRKELADLPQTKKFTQAVPAYKAIADASGRDTKQADINLVYGLAKLYDPDSVVREGEYDTIANSQTIPEWLKGMAASLAGSGGRLTPATRAQILTEARGRLKTYESEYTAAKESYSRIATQRGANPENVVVPIGTDIGRTPPPSGAGGWTIQRR